MEDKGVRIGEIYRLRENGWLLKVTGFAKRFEDSLHGYGYWLYPVECVSSGQEGNYPRRALSDYPVAEMEVLAWMAK